MNTIILKVFNSYIQEDYSLRKTIGLLDAKGMYQLIKSADLDANPRLAKSSKITDAIIDTLESNPELFMFKSKGILVSARQCEALDRSRFRLTFEEPQLEGILDGGHNTLSIAMYLINLVLTDLPKTKLNSWNKVKGIFQENYDLIEKYINENIDELNFKVPIEIISPAKNEAEFFDHILEISASRNNNAQLTETAKGNHSGYYSYLSKCLDSQVEKNVEWKQNELGKPIKSPDVISLALIPFLSLQDKNETDFMPKINPVSLYSGKGLCVKIFNEFMVHKDVSLPDEKERLVIHNTKVKNALSLMHDIPDLYDHIYETFPEAYNSQSPGFGRIDCVKQYKEGIESGGSYLGRPPLTKFYLKKTKYKYPDGFIIPIVAGLSKLIKCEGEKVIWSVNSPKEFIDKHLKEIVSVLVDLIKQQNYNPQSIGKSSGAYKAVGQSIEMALLKEQYLN